MSSGKCCGTVPTVWIGGNWRCSECDGVVVTYEEKQLEFPVLPKPIIKSKCDCGAKVAKTTCANWCSTKGAK